MRRYSSFLLCLVTAVIGAVTVCALSSPGFAETDFVVPPGRAAYPLVITAGPDHNLWFTENGGLKIGTINLQGVITEYPIAGAQGLCGITTGPDGNLWFTDELAGTIGHISVTGGNLVIYSLPAGSHPEGIVTGPDGKLWFVDGSIDPQNPANGFRVGRIDTAGNVAEYPTGINPIVFDPYVYAPGQITRGPDGNLWFTNANAANAGIFFVGKITTAGVVTIYNTADLPNGITTGPDGNLWAIESSNVAKISTSGVETEYPLTNSLGLYGIATGPDGNIWFTEFGGIGYVTTGGIVNEFPQTLLRSQRYLTSIASGTDGALWVVIGLTGSDIARFTTTGQLTNIYALNFGSTPSWSTPGPDGAVWFSQRFADRIGRIDTNGVITSFPTAQGAAPQGIVTGPDNNLWFVEAGTYNIAKMTTHGAITEYSVGQTNPGLWEIAVGPDGNLWFTEYRAPYNNIVRITTDGVMTPFPIPTSNALAYYETSGPDGKVWFTEYGSQKVANINPSTGQITEYPYPGTGKPPESIVTGPDGNLWIMIGSDYGAIAKFSPSGNLLGEFPALFQTLDDIKVGTDGALWFDQFYPNGVGRITTSGVVSLVPLTAPNAQGGAPSFGADGKLWIPLSAPGAIGRLSAIGGTGNAITATVGSQFNGAVAIFVDGTPTATQANFTSVIDWGDGTGPTVGTVSGPTGGPFTVSGTHTYSASGNYAVSVILYDTVDNAIYIASPGSALVSENGLIATATAIMSSPNPSSFMEPVTFTATVTAQDGSSPTGSVNFIADGNAICSGIALVQQQGHSVATCMNATLAVGSHSIVADYNGGGAYNPSQSQSLTQTVNTGAGNGTLTGMYAGTFSGYDHGNWFVGAVSLAADGNGNITGGETDSNNAISGVKHAIITSGNYSISSNGLGQINWTDSDGGNAQILIATGAGDDLQIIGYNNGTDGGWGAGVLRQQNPLAFNLAALAGNWAFGVEGLDPSGNPLGADASYQESSNGNISGVIDINDFGTNTTDTAFNETPTSSIDANGRLTTQFQIAGQGTTTFSYYVISANEVVGLQTSSGEALLVVDALRQSGTMNNGILNGKAIARESKQGNSNGSPVNAVFAALGVFDGQGNLTITQDRNEGGVITLHQTEIFTYSVASNGRTTLLQNGQPNSICYVVQQNEGFCIDGDTGSQYPGLIFFEPQASGPFNNSSLSGVYLGGSLPQYVSGNFDEVDSNAFDGIGSYDSTFTQSGPNGTNQNQMLNGTYAIDSTGRITISQSGNPLYYGYVISPNKYQVISLDNNPRLLLEAQPISMFTLTVSINGSGTVTSTDGFINCPGVCSHSYPNHTPVTLNATPASGQIFAGWSGACTGTGPCNLTITQDLSVTATFMQVNYVLTVSVNGSGNVTSTDGDINCPGTCGNSYPSNTPVTMNAPPAPGWSFAGWSGACSGAGPCNVTMTQDLSVTATFTQNQGFYNLTVSTSGIGTVTSTDGDINCPGICSHTYPANAPVTLNATAAPGEMFTGWSGACSGTGPCNLTVTQNLSVTAAFTGVPDAVMHSFGTGHDGQSPMASLVFDSAGNLYGTTSGGGMYGKGTVFELSSNGTQTILHSFGNGNDGQTPLGNLIFDSAGNLYGTTFAGGISGNGMVFELSPNGTETALYNFGNGGDGQNPNAGLVFDSSGNLYGTTVNGGANSGGTAFELSPDGAGGWTENGLYSFGSGSDGMHPYSGLILDGSGNLYGTTANGGVNGGGTAFELSTNSAVNRCCREILVYGFGGSGDGLNPHGTLVFDSSGNLYGTTVNGGANGGGTAFELSPNGGGGWTESVAYSFGNGSDGRNPYAGLVFDRSGTNLYGTTTNGGLSSAGTIFELLPITAINRCCREMPVYSFGAGSDGRNPQAAVIFNPAGNNLYGTTMNGGVYGGGTVFGITPAPSPVQFVTVTPCRVVDTRNANGTFGGPAIQGDTSRSFPIPQSTACNIPSSAAAYSLNVTVVPHHALGYLTIWPTGETQPYVSTMNSPDGRVKANAAIVPSGASGAVSVYVTDTSDVVLDIDGYFAPASSQTLQFYPLTPCRVVDTRDAQQPQGLGPPSFGNRETRPLPIPSSPCFQGLSQQPLAYSFNITAVPKNGQYLNYLSIWPSDQQQPYVSTLNNPTATVVANAAIVPAAANGNVSVFTSNSTDVIMDINGYFAAPGGNGYSFYAVTPCRVYDTRLNNGPPFHGERTVSVVNSQCAPPSSAQGYVLNTTVVPSAFLDYLSLWPDTEQQPVVSTLNAYDGLITSNMAIVPNINGSLDSYASQLTHLILDISGYFAP